MINDGWGKEWPSVTPKEWPNLTNGKQVPNIAYPINFALIPRIYTNLHPTHDPYTNPNAHIYYQCNCGAILDPGTKSFAALNNAAMNSGWKVRWGETSYQPYCVECGKDVE